MKFLALIILFFSLNGCGSKGLIITDCTPRPKEKNWLCSNPSNPNGVITPSDNIDNWICVSAADNLSLQKACMNKIDRPAVKVCAFSATAMAFTCFNEVDGQASGFPFSQSDGLICISAVDEQIALDFCRNLRNPIKPS